MLNGQASVFVLFGQLKPAGHLRHDVLYAGAYVAKNKRKKLKTRSSLTSSFWFAKIRFPEGSASVCRQILKINCLAILQKRLNQA